MGKSWKYLIPYILICGLLSGCGNVSAASSAKPDLVSRVEVSYRNQGIHLLRCYTATDKMDAVLCYLYSLSPFGHVDEDPEQLCGQSCSITVTTTGGIMRTYRQMEGKYLSVDGRPWQKIDPKKSVGLFPLLARMCSDVP